MGEQRHCQALRYRARQQLPASKASWKVLLLLLLLVVGWEQEQPAWATEGWSPRPMRSLAAVE